MVTPSLGARGKLCRIRTYSHTLLTYAAARRFRLKGSSAGAGAAPAAALGATVPDLPVAVGAAWLWVRRRLYSRADFLEEVCGRDVFRKPDAALHSVLPVTITLALYSVLVARSHDRREAALAFLLGWAGHVTSDTLTHGSDARPPFWPLSGWRFKSPVSYRERERYGLAFALAEHAILLIVAARTFHSGYAARAGD